jgi:hypothetical protein
MSRLIRAIAFALLFALAGTTPAPAEQPATDVTQVWPETGHSKTKDGFAALLLITDDPDWEAKWNTPPETKVHFKDADKVRVGEKLVILTFFANPKPDAANRVSILCDLKITRPDGTFAADERGLNCTSGELEGDPSNIRLTPVIVHVIAEETDQRGEWVVDVGITDAVRATRLELTRKFTLIDG